MILRAFSLVLWLIACSVPAQAADTRDASRFFTLSTGDLTTEAADARAGRKKALLLVFEQEGCPGCLYMRRSVFNQARVQDYYGANFTALAIDIYGSVPLRDFGGREHTEKSYAQSIKVRGTPTFVFHDLAGKELVRIFGTIDTPEEFLLLGEFVTSGAYRTRTFAQYKTEKSFRKGS
jgi:thioredoxin-related protein